ncbi:hypothetical protein DF3PA_10205 [Candidatus Defluviicoccus seviourii]|uniref:Uncharacterized protein n=1 Tax=Candidatus Defluviicoccus seviourii TaxID=2565273 RepID=A0A564WC43_9PROT|nr:hypothetical protein DF3PA_10205 [Candidatus Defluviicoccus seviourii]
MEHGEKLNFRCEERVQAGQAGAVTVQGLAQKCGTDSASDGERSTIWARGGLVWARRAVSLFRPGRFAGIATGSCI